MPLDGNDGQRHDQFLLSVTQNQLKCLVTLSGDHISQAVRVWRLCAAHNCWNWVFTSCFHSFHSGYLFRHSTHTECDATNYYQSGITMETATDTRCRKSSTRSYSSYRWCWQRLSFQVNECYIYIECNNTVVRACVRDVCVCVTPFIFTRWLLMYSAHRSCLRLWFLLSKVMVKYFRNAQLN